MKVQVLVACMNQSDFSIVKRSNIQTDAVVVNQCDKDEIHEFDFQNAQGKTCHVKFINTTERGLSRSRNMAIRNALGDICLICDDDELLEDNMEQIVVDAHKKHPDEAIITFALKRKEHRYPVSEMRVNIKQILRTSSVQITFKRKPILDKQLRFDVIMGSGTGNGAGEECKFLMDCKRSGLNAYYVPKEIATVISENSQWHNGYSKKYFKDFGWNARRILGFSLSIPYVIYWCFVRSSYHKVGMNKFKIFRYSVQGLFEKR